MFCIIEAAPWTPFAIVPFDRVLLRFVMRTYSRLFASARSAILRVSWHAASFTKKRRDPCFSPPMDMNQGISALKISVNDR